MAAGKVCPIWKEICSGEKAVHASVKAQKAINFKNMLDY